jgi:hypothetical protein
MDELFWGCDYENVNNWAELLAMTTEVLELNVNKLFKIPKLKLCGKMKKWFKILNSS